MQATVGFAKGVATTALLACVAVLFADGVAGATPSPSGRIVFASTLPAYPLPDNFQSTRVFSIGLDGRGRREVKPASDWTSSNDGARIYFTRDTAEGAEVWVARIDGTGARRLALLARSGPATEIDSSTDGSLLAIVAGGLWVVGADGSAPHAVFTPSDGTAVSRVAWSGGHARLVFEAGDLWTARPYDQTATRVFTVDHAVPLSASLSPDGSRLVVSNGGTWLVSADGVLSVALPGGGAVDWAKRGGRFALEQQTSVDCGEHTTCVDAALLTFDDNGNRLGEIDHAGGASWSPDGAWLAFGVGPDAVDPEDGIVEVAHADGSGRRSMSRKVANGGDCWSSPSWIGSGEVTFEAGGCDPDTYSPTRYTVVVAVPSGRVVRLLDGGQLTLSPNRRQLAYLRLRGNDVQLVVATPTGRKPIRLSPRHGTVDDFAWSHDGRTLAFSFASSEYQGEQIYVVPAHGGHPRRITHEPDRSYEWGISWLGRLKLVYSADLEELGYDALWTIGPAGEAPQRLTHNETNAASPSWSPDGRRIAFTRYVADHSEIDVVDADGAHEHTVVGKPTEKDAQPAWSPDGKRIAFVREVKGSLRLAVANADGTKVRLLPVEDSPYGVPSWSPDGRELVFSDSGIALMSVAPDGSNRHAVLQLGCGPSLCPHIGDAAFSADGSRIAFGCLDCDAATSNGGLWIVNANGTGLTRVATIFANHPSWSGDGSRIAFSGPCGPLPPDGANPLWQTCVIGADGTGLRALTSWPYGTSGPSWSPR